MIDPTTTDRQIVDAVLGGQRDAFRGLVERESSMVLGVCGRILRDPVEAEDVAQEAFTQAYQFLATFRGDGPFGAWLRRIAVRTAIARLATRRRTLMLDTVAIEPDLLSRADDDPEVRLLDREHRAAVGDAVAALPSAQREVVMLRFYGDLSLQEIAQITNRPIGTVKSRLSRGVESLRDHLEPGSAA